MLSLSLSLSLSRCWMTNMLWCVWGEAGRRLRVTCRSMTRVASPPSSAPGSNSQAGPTAVAAVTAVAVVTAVAAVTAEAKAAAAAAAASPLVSKRSRQTATWWLAPTPPASRSNPLATRDDWQHEQPIRLCLPVHVEPIREKLSWLACGCPSGQWDWRVFMEKGIPEFIFVFLFYCWV